ncbi:uncharacterized protein LOC118744354 [Rhagoletis pomonella]|uniref:uncharacterized protein LOC118744354 n=1 Tax=Rhagoletis pomonella TaxID=28610 RepID=UPI00177D93A6|nr:uncharacterized protein LOC118744354 [Rhagoletis pomonella]
MGRMPMCRICFKESLDNFSIFKYVKKNYLPSIIYLISGVKVSKEHDNDAQICQHCAASVLVAQNIILRIQESEEFFQFQRLQDSCLQKLPHSTSTNEYSLLNDYEVSQAASTSSGANVITEVQPIISNRAEETDTNCSSLCEPASKRSKNDVTTSSHIFNCDHCDYSTKIGKRIIEHRQTKHGVCDPNIYACNLCTQSFSWKPTLYRHI